MHNDIFNFHSIFTLFCILDEEIQNKMYSHKDSKLSTERQKSSKKRSHHEESQDQISSNSSIKIECQKQTDTLLLPKPKSMKINQTPEVASNYHTIGDHKVFRSMK